MTTLYVIEQHDQLLHLWHEQNLTGLRIAHFDFHCDMRDLLIHRQRQQAYQIGDHLPELDEGNFLTHAIIEGRVQSIRWIHRLPGGRQYDVGTVKYETDLTGRLLSWLLALKHRPGQAIDYEVMEFADWQGLHQGEFLDIDWDFFACQDYAKESIDSQVERFLKMDLGSRPEFISVCYSPDFSHPSRAQFEAFVQRLAQTFQAEIIRLPLPPQPSEAVSGYKKYIPKSLYQLTRHKYYQTNLWFRRRGIY